MWTNIISLIFMLKSFVVVCVCETEPPAINTTATVYNNIIESTHTTERNTKIFLKETLEDFHVKVVQKTAEVRLQMMVHKNHGFQTNDNVEWNRCVESQNKTISNLDEEYVAAEFNCTKISLREIKQNKRGITQIVKEIQNWRKGYKYLISLCEEKYPKNIENITLCLDEMLLEDNYNNTLSRLNTLLEESISSIQDKSKDLISKLQKCLEKGLSDYLENIRIVIETINMCYERGGEKKAEVSELRTLVKC